MNDKMRHITLAVTGTSKEAVARGLERAIEQYRGTDYKAATDEALDEIGSWRYAYQEVTSDD